MKAFKYYASAFLLAFASATFVACDDNDIVDKGEPESPEATTHFDIWVTLGKSSGMGGSTETILVKGVKSLETGELVDFKNDGLDVTAKLFQETIVKGKYYYQIPQEKDRFGKYQLAGNELKVVAEQPFAVNTYKDRRYAFDWLDDKTLLIIAANGKADKIIWTKINSDDMSILAEGTLNLEVPAGDKFSTSGLVRYRKSDKTLIYAYQHKKEEKNFYVAFINAADMSVKNNVSENRAEFMAGTAYGELLQNKMFFDENENLYIACNSISPDCPPNSSTWQYGRLLRINKGATEFDKSYEGYKYETGKIITVEYLTKNKALLYIQDPKYVGLAPDKWSNNYNSYYAILDLTTDEKTEIKYEGKVLPYNSGTFSQRSMVLEDKAYIGVNPEHSAPCIYVYDIPTGKVTKGVEIKDGYTFTRFHKIEE